jgi:chorismate mutase/prephenate dehydrogenase
MNIMHISRDFMVFLHGLYLSEEKVDLQKLLELSSPSYHLELMMIGRLLSQDPYLYTQIIMSYRGNLTMIRRYAKYLDIVVNILEEDDIQKFIRKLELTKNWFRNYIGYFSSESSHLLSMVGDHSKKIGSK